MPTKLKLKSEFSRNVLTLMTGTTIAQAIPIAVSPILTRIYTPADFGLFSVYMSISTIIAVVATGRYELAIMLPKKDEDAVNIVALSLIISLFVSVALLFIVFVFNKEIAFLLKSPEIINWLYFIPITVLITGIYQSLNYWNNRKKKYKILSTSRVVQSATTVSVNLGMGFAKLSSSGLIVGGILGQGIATGVLAKIFINEDKNIFRNVKTLKIYALSKRYIKFPKFDIIATMCNVASHRVSHILFTSIFDTTISGYYYLTQRIFSLPIGVIATSISDVFKEKITKEYNNQEDIKKTFLKTMFYLILLSSIPSIILYQYAIDLFIFIFGKQWAIAGEFTQILVPFLFFRFISTPLSYIFYLAEKQHHNVVGQFILLTFVFMSFYLGKDDSYIQVVYFISYSFSTFYLLYIILSYKYIVDLTKSYTIKKEI